MPGLTSSTPGRIAEQVAATAARSPRCRSPTGAVPWTLGGHTDIWNHVEAAMALLVGGQLDGGGARLRLGAERPSGPTAPGR